MGLVVTNNHVIEGADQVRVSLADKREFEAEMVLKDSRSDLAVLRLKAHNERFPALELADSDALQVGDVVLAIGNPDRKSTRLNSSHANISYAVFCLKKKSI